MIFVVESFHKLRNQNEQNSKTVKWHACKNEIAKYFLSRLAHSSYIHTYAVTVGLRSSTADERLIHATRIASAAPNTARSSCLQTRKMMTSPKKVV